MPNYTIKATFTYPLEAESATDALSTVPFLIKLKYPGVYIEGLTEIIDAATGEVVLKAVLKNKAEVNR